MRHAQVLRDLLTEEWPTLEVDVDRWANTLPKDVTIDQIITALAEWQLEHEHTPPKPAQITGLILARTKRARCRELMAEAKAAIAEKIEQRPKEHIPQ